MSLSEADTRAKFIDPALHRRGWTEDLIRREETDCGIDIIEGKPRRRKRGRTDYLLRIRVNISTQPVPIVLIEGKRSLENPYVFNAPNVVKAGGIRVPRILGDPKDIIKETKERLFAA